MSTSPIESTQARRTLYTLFAANAISMTGNQLTILAVPWFVLSTTGSAAQTGITAFFTILPAIIAGFFGGVIVDRMGYKRASVASDVASGATVALIPLLYSLNLLPFWLLLVLVFLGALLDAPGSTARAALVPELANAAQMSLERATSLMQIVERSSRLVGFPLAGVLVAALGAQTVLWIDAVTFAVSALMVAVFITTPEPEPEMQESEGYLAELVTGLQFIRGDALLLLLITSVMITNFLDAAQSSVILPVYANDVYGNAVSLGLMFGHSGGGAVVGALLYSALGPRYLRRKWLIVALALTSIPRIALLFFPPLYVILLTQTLVGIASGPLNPILMTTFFERIPADLRGRIIGTTSAGAMVAMPLGVLLAGYLVEWGSLRLALSGVIGGYLLTTVMLFFSPTLQEMDSTT